MAESVNPLPAFLGIERSLTGRRWVARLEDERTALALAQRAGVPEIVGRVLAARGVGLDDVETFLAPRLRAQLPDPAHLRGMDVAVDRLVRAITAGETIGVFGDYDVDGATSAALLARFFKALGRAIQVYVPDRLREGYGPNVAALRRLKGSGVGVVVTVDCGTTAFAALAEAKALGLDVIVVDHHVAEPRLPEALAVINPNRLDETSPHGQLAAVGVAFLLVVALNRALREAHWYGEGHPEPDLMAWLDLVALGTVCDVVPLTGANRALVAQGLKVMARRANCGLAALADVARLDERPDAYHAGFVLGPRVNAGGRVGEAGLGARLLASDDALEARAIAVRLDQMNRERQDIETGVLAAALLEAEREAAAGDETLIVAGEGWHPGVIGIVAGRLRERFNVPSCVVALMDGVGKGSGRSVPGVKLGAAVIAARQAGLLIDGGGHDMAAGFTVRTAVLSEFRAFLADHVRQQLGGERLVPGLSLDGALAPSAATADLVAVLDRAAPFGAGNPRPRFAFPAVRIAYAEAIGNGGGHVRLRIAAGDGGRTLKAIAFRAAGTPLGEALLTSAGAALHLAGHLKRDTWNGANGVDLVIEDAARA
jgi:single-stranded-DNA-specific exonuclease